MLTRFLQSLFITLFVLLFTGTATAQDAPGPEDATTLFSMFRGTLSRGTVIKTANNHFYEINDKINQKITLSASTELKIFKEGKKYKISIQGIDKILACNRLQEVIESNIDGDFKGWDGTTTFKLLNQEEWKQDNPTGTIFVNLYRPAVMIYLTPEGYKMKITGVDEDPILVKKVR